MRNDCREGRIDARAEDRELNRDNYMREGENTSFPVEQQAEDRERD